MSVPDAAPPPDAMRDCGPVCADERACGTIDGCDCGTFCVDDEWCGAHCVFAECQGDRCCLPEGSTCDAGAGQCCDGLTCLTLCILL